MKQTLEMDRQPTADERRIAARQGIGEIVFPGGSFIRTWIDCPPSAPTAFRLAWLCVPND